MERVRKLLSEKTLKREYGVILVGLLGLKIYEGDVAMVEAIIYPTLTYVCAVAGIHLTLRKPGAQ